MIGEQDQFFVPDKDPDYIYRWLNNDERTMRVRQRQGYEVVLDTKAELPTAALVPEGQTVTRKRGPDLVLGRIKRDVHTKNVESRRQLMRDQQAGALDAAIEGINQSAVRGVRRGTGKAPTRSLVFREAVPDEN